MSTSRMGGSGCDVSPARDPFICIRFYQRVSTTMSASEYAMVAVLGVLAVVMVVLMAVFASGGEGSGTPIAACARRAHWVLLQQSAREKVMRARAKSLVRLYPHAVSYEQFPPPPMPVVHCVPPTDEALAALKRDLLTRPGVQRRGKNYRALHPVPHAIILRRVADPAPETLKASALTLDAKLALAALEDLSGSVLFPKVVGEPANDTHPLSPALLPGPLSSCDIVKNPGRDL